MAARPFPFVRAAAMMVIVAQWFEFSCGGAAPPATPPMTGKNSAILKEVKAEGLWFHAKKTRPIWVRLLEQDETVETLEGDERVPAGNYLCRGEAGDIWPQSAERLTAKYTLTGEIDDRGWKKCLPRPNAAGVLAAQVSHPFDVHAKWGKLSGKANDYLVKNYEDRDQEEPSDVWIVDRKLFEATYERVVAVR